MASEEPKSDPTIPGNDGSEPDTDRLAWAFFRALRDRSPDDRLFVFRALTARLSAGPSNAPERVTLATNALAACMEAIGKTPSRRSYDEWRASQERPSEWPSATSIRDTFGPSWARALDALGVEPAPDVRARRLLNISRGYEKGELLEAIRTCVEATHPADRLTLQAYRAWACQELAHPDGPKRRMPLASPVFTKHFGSWAGAVAAAGFPELISMRGRKRRSGPRGAGDHYTAECILGHLRQAAGETKKSKVTGKLTMPAYVAWRQEKIDLAVAGGQVIYIPGSQVVQRRYGSWPGALQAAGLATENEARLAPQRGARPLTDEEVLTCVVAALRDDGYSTPDSANGWKVAEDDAPGSAVGASADKEKPVRPKLWLTRADYNRWRRQRLLDGDYNGPRVCGDQLIRQRFGSWVEVIDLANERLVAESGEADA